MLVENYFKALDDKRTGIIEKVDLEDIGKTPSEEALDLAKEYGVTATPVLVVTAPNGVLLEKKIGGMEITQNIKKLLTQYAKS